MLNQKFCMLLTCTLVVVSAFCWSLAAIPPPGVQAVAAQPQSALPLGFSADNRATFADTSQEIFSINFLRSFAATLITETKKITASDGANFDQFGLTVALSGDTAVVGANQDAGGPGAAYVFQRNQGGANNWGQVKILTVTAGVFNDQFGISVAINGDTIVVGAWRNNSDRGAAYIFDRNQGGANNWGQVKKLTASDGVLDDQFGISVAISNDTVVVGANGDDLSRGSAYVFDRNQGGINNWGQVKKLTASDGVAGDQFGNVAISGDSVVVGAQFDDSSRGAAYVFDRNQGGSNNWGEVRKLTASEGAASDQFGGAVAINIDTVVVGAIGDDDNGSLSGSAYIFDRNQGGLNNWGFVKKLTASDGTASDQFGSGVTISGNHVIVGAIGDGAGSAYPFERDQGGFNNWGQLDKFTASDGANGDRFGGAVALNNNAIVVGASADDTFRGSAYIFYMRFELYLPIILKS